MSWWQTPLLDLMVCIPICLSVCTLIHFWGRK